MSDHEAALGWQVNAMHMRAQLAESRAEKAEKALRKLTGIHNWHGHSAQSQARITQLEEALRRYGRHDDLCAVVGGYPYGCTCGLRAVLANKEETPRGST